MTVHISLEAYLLQMKPPGQIPVDYIWNSLKMYLNGSFIFCNKLSDIDKKF